MEDQVLDVVEQQGLELDAKKGLIGLAVAVTGAVLLWGIPKVVRFVGKKIKARKAKKQEVVAEQAEVTE